MGFCYDEGKADSSSVRMLTTLNVFGIFKNILYSQIASNAIAIYCVNNIYMLVLAYEQDKTI